MFLSVGCSLQSVKRRYLFAEQLWYEQKYEAAVQEFDRIAAADANGTYGTQALYRAAMTQAVFLGQPVLAIEKLTKYADLVSNEKSKWEAFKFIGDLYYERLGQYENAIRHYRQLITSYPEAREVPDFLLRIGKSHYHLSEFDEALEAYHELLKKFPSARPSERAMFEIGTTLFTKGQVEPEGEVVEPNYFFQAKSAFILFQRSFPGSELKEQARFNVAECLEEMGQLTEAKAQYEQLLTSYPLKKIVRLRILRVEERISKKDTKSGAAKT